MANAAIISAPKQALGKEALEVRIKTGKGAVGTLLLTATKIKWLPSHKAKKGFDLSWDKFAEAIPSIAEPGTVPTKRSKTKQKIQKAAKKLALKTTSSNTDQ